MARNIILPLGDRVMGTSISRHLKFLEKSQWWSIEELKAYQNNKLRRLIRHVYENVSYYHTLLKESHIHPDDITTTTDLTKLRLNSKANINNNLKELTSSDIHKRKWEYSSSGGTTGQTLIYKRDTESRDFRRAANIRGWEWAGFSQGDKYAYLWSNPSTEKHSKKFSSKVMDFWRRKLYLNMYNVNEDVLHEYIALIKKVRPEFLRGYPNAIHTLSMMLGEDDLKFGGIITTGETLSSEMRKELMSRFKCDVFDEYGGEASAKANECHTHEGYHIPIEGVIMEFLKDGEPVSPGETGEIVLTDLNNYVMPFIRYRIGDLGDSSEGPCSCGRGLPLIKRINGRVSDVITTPSGRILTRPSFFGSSNIKYIQGLIEYQIFQQRINKIIIKAVGDDTFSEESEHIMMIMARDAVGEDVEIEIKRVNSIPLAASGKRKVIISNVKYDFN